MITKIKNINVYNTSQRIFESFDVYIKNDRFYYIGLDELDFDFEIDGMCGYMVPGLIDSHMHIESSMATPQEFSNTVLPLGTTTILADAHEVGNVFGYEGLLEYMNQSQQLDIFYAIPSSVPSTNPFLETTGGVVDAQAVKKLAEHPKVIALGEIMNFKDVVSDEVSNTSEIIDTFKSVMPGYPIEGHIPRISGLELAKFVYRGIGSDHTQQTVASLIEKTRAGLLVQLQEKSLNEEIIEAVYRYDLLNSIALVTDDVMPDDLMEKGHMNHLIRYVMRLGMKLEDAIYIATATPARRLRLDDRGIIAPGKLADFVIIDGVSDFNVVNVFKRGVDVSTLEKDSSLPLMKVGQSSIQRKLLEVEDFFVKSDKDFELIRVIERESGSTFTKEVHMEVAVVNGFLQWQDAGLNLMCVVERYGHQAPLKFGFVKNGFNKRCALATSWAHDHHNILVMGTCIEGMKNAVNEVIDLQGGISFKGMDSISISLPYGGIVSLEPMADLGHKMRELRKLMKDYGYTSHNEFMSFAVLSLLVSPELKMSDKGYVRVLTQEILDWRVN